MPFVFNFTNTWKSARCENTSQVLMQQSKFRRWVPMAGSRVVCANAASSILVIGAKQEANLRCWWMIFYN